MEVLGWEGFDEEGDVSNGDESGEDVLFAGDGVRLGAGKNKRQGWKTSVSNGGSVAENEDAPR